MILEKLSTMLPLILWFLGNLAVYSLLARFFPNIPGQKILRKGFFTDVIYYVAMPSITGTVQALMAALMLALVFWGDRNSIKHYWENGGWIAAHLPLWLQIGLLLIISDIIMYWWHRYFHSSKAWKYHAIHHSPTEIDWLSAGRFHPVNSFISFSLTGALMVLLGFSPECFAALIPFNIIMNGIVHANLSWTFGSFKYVLASPVFHRWHHTKAAEGLNKNFAPTFPILDVIFGTFYMPKGKLPHTFGTDDPVPENIIGQFTYPFEKPRI